MAQEWAKAFYKSDKWNRCRRAFIDERVMHDGGLCQVCGILPGYIVHHKTILTQDNIGNPDVSLNHSNLMYVCKPCHDRFEGHGLHKGIAPLCVFDSYGQPISLRDIDRNGYPPMKSS